VTNEDVMGGKEQKSTKKVSTFTMVLSIIAGGFGVQTKANRERDFEHGKAHHFIIGGIIFAILFILAVVGIVKIVMSTAGV
jgi:Protein of unknown function (DUF2970)